MPATREQVYAALKAADKAGNVEDATKLARIYASMKQSSQQQEADAGGRGPVQDFADTFVKSVTAPFTELRRQYDETVQRSKAPPPTIGEFLNPINQAKWAANDVGDVGRLIGSGLGVLASPVTAGFDALVAAPMARAVPTQKGKTRAETMAAARADFNTAMMALKPVPGMMKPIPARPIDVATGPVLKAQNYVQGLMRAAKVTPEMLDQADQAGTAAEAIGRNGNAALGAFARRSGTTGDALQGLAQARAAGRGAAMQDDFMQAVGIAPEAAQGDIESLVTKGRAAAKPLYKAAFDGDPVMSNRLQSLASRPSVKKALPMARSLAREMGENPDALGFSTLDNMAEWESAIPPDMQASSAVPPAARGPAKPPTQGKSLNKFLADAGGVQDVSGDLAAMDAGLWHSGKAYQRKLIGKLHPDDAALKAWEAGYFPQYAERPTINQLYDAMAGEMQGRPRYAKQVDQAHLDRYNARQAADEMAYYGHTSEPPISEADYTGRPEPMGGPTFEAQPTLKTWDYVKRALDDELQSRKDQFGRLPDDNSTRALIDTLSQLRGELRSQKPQYATALDTSGEYLSAQEAFKKGQKLTFDPNVTERQFADHFGSLTAGQKEAFKGGIANQYFDLSQKGKLNPAAFKTPRIRQKLNIVFGREQADALIASVERHGKLAAFENRYAPQTNSISSEILQALQEQDAALGNGAIHNFVAKPKTTILNKVGAGAQSAVDWALGPGAQAARDQAGDILMKSPAEVANLIRQAQATQKQLAARRAAIAKRAVPVAVIGGSSNQKTRN